jgi:ABC-type sugar transport system permease subunit
LPSRTGPPVRASRSSAWAIFSIWHFLGFQILIFLGGIGNIPVEYYEAAKLDGANQWQLFRRITLPLLSPQIFFVFTIASIGVLRAFNEIFILTNGGPLDTTRTVTLLVFRTFFQQGQIGLGSAMGVLLTLVILAFTLVQFRFLERRGAVHVNTPQVLPRAITQPVRPRVPPITGTLFKHLILIVVGVAVAYPFYFMITSAFKDFSEATDDAADVLADVVAPGELRRGLGAAALGALLRQHVLHRRCQRRGEIVIAVLAAYAFAQMNFRGKNVLFALFPRDLHDARRGDAHPELRDDEQGAARREPVLPDPAPRPLRHIRRADPSVPGQRVLGVPAAPAVPAIPKELRDCRGHRRRRTSALPLVGRASDLRARRSVTVAILSFYASWNRLPVAVHRHVERGDPTHPGGSERVPAEAGSQYHLLMAAASFVVAPIVLLYLVGQRFWCRASHGPASAASVHAYLTRGTPGAARMVEEVGRHT